MFASLFHRRVAARRRKHEFYDSHCAIKIDFLALKSPLSGDEALSHPSVSSSTCETFRRVHMQCDETKVVEVPLKTIEKFPRLFRLQCAEKKTNREVASGVGNIH